MRLLLLVAIVVLLPLASALEPEWDTPRGRERVGDNALMLIHPTSVVVGTAAHFEISGWNAGERMIHITRPDGSTVHEQHVPDYTRAEDHLFAGALWHVPAELEPGTLVLRVEMEQHLVESHMQVLSAPHVYVRNAAPVGAGGYLDLEAVGFQGVIDVTVIQSGLVWTARIEEGSGEPMARGSVSASFAVPGAEDPQRVFRVVKGDQSVHVGPLVIGGPVHVWFNGTSLDVPAHAAFSFEAPIWKTPEVWVLEIYPAITSEVHVAGIGFEGDVRILLDGSPVATPRHQMGFWSAVLTVAPKETAYELLVEDVLPDAEPRVFEFKVQVQPPPEMHGSPGPGLLLVLLAAGLALAWRRRG